MGIGTTTSNRRLKLFAIPRAKYYTSLVAQIDINLFRDYEKNKLITCREHNNGNLLIWNYTQRCQFDRIWDDITTQARGLITDTQGNIKARPFKKFFNFGEHAGADKLSLDGATVTEKHDGSLGIMYHDGLDYALATRGSFYSDQANRGTEMLQDLFEKFGYSWVRNGVTYLFEIIYSDNRIVVQYDEEFLALLAAFHTETGVEIPHEELPLEKLKVQKWTDFSDLKELYSLERDNSEGLVVHFPNGLRLKVKWDEYVRLHRIVTGVTARSIWECLKNGDSLDEILNRVPDEFYDWVQKTKEALLAKYSDELLLGKLLYAQVKDLPTKKDQALHMKDSNPVSRSIAFSLIDNKEERIPETIWKSLKPVHEKPFKKDIDA